jgi:hypothetical protein
MVRYFLLTLLTLTLLCGGIGCAPKQVGPTAPSGYVFSFSAFPPSITSASSFSTTEDLPGSRRQRSAELLVRIEDGQGRPSDGIPVVFQVDPAWVAAAEVVPSRVLSQGGRAQARFRSGLVGIVPVVARVEDTTEQITIAVSAPGGGVSAAGGGGSGP